MSDPTVLLQAPPGLVSPGPNMVLEVASYEEWPTVTFLGTHLLQSNCFTLVDDAAVDTLPMNHYDIDHYYCRTGIRVAMDDPEPNKLLAEVQAPTPFLLVRLVPQVCGRDVSIASVLVTNIALTPLGGARCVAVGYVSHSGGEAYLAVDRSFVPLPIVAKLTIVAGGLTRSGIIRIVP